MRGDFDVAVVGGGPAGGAAAAELAARGLAVVLLERDAGASNRLCGEFLSPDGVASLVALGGRELLRRAAAPAVARWSVAAGEAEISGEFAEAGAGISRRRLDSGLRAIAGASGADVREGCRVTGVETAGDGRRVIRIAGGEAVVARAVLGAAGRGARVPGLAEGARRRGRPRHVALKAHFRGLSDGVVRVFALHGLYVGVSPVDGGAVNVCLLARREAFERAGRDADALLEAEAARSPRFRVAWKRIARAEPWVSAAGMDWGRRMPVGPAGLLAGDAAAQIAPFLGEGMSMAMESGRLAALWTAAALTEPAVAARPEAAAAAYAREWRRRFRGRLRTGRALHGLLLSPRAAGAAVRALGLLPGAADRIVRATRADAAGGWQ